MLCGGAGPVTRGLLARCGGFRRKKPGPKERWSKTARLELVKAIERKLRARPGAKKSVEPTNITEELRGDPRWPSGLTAKALERVHENTKPEWDRLEAATQGQGRSLLDDGCSLQALVSPHGPPRCCRAPRPPRTQTGAASRR